MSKYDDTCIKDNSIIGKDGRMDHCRSSGSMWSGPTLSGGHCPEADAGFPVEARLPHSHIVSALADRTSQTMGPTVDLSCLSKIKES